MDYGRAVRVARSARMLSQKALAERLEVHPSFVSHIEAGTRKPGTQTLEAIAKALEVPLYLLLLLGSDDTDLEAVSRRDAAALGESLLRVLVRIPG